MASETPKEVDIGDGVVMVKNSPIFGGFHGFLKGKTNDESIGKNSAICRI